MDAIRLFRYAALQVKPADESIAPYSYPVVRWCIDQCGVAVVIEGDPPPAGLVCLNIDGLPVGGTRAAPEDWRQIGTKRRLFRLLYPAQAFERPEAQFKFPPVAELIPA